jgi:hypothetical protein
MSTFNFGAAGGGPPSENPDGGGDDKDKKIEELERKLANMKLKYMDVKGAYEDTQRELVQAKSLLTDGVNTATVFNQLQVYIHSLKF